ncbi:MAG: isoprenylcysteine carboxylmethyltransferase family protein [Ignavibacteriales bacterium]|nr:isoprenylcysteine carboxylmethyltransferase family protein [Ignavibacteriales bacterium]
MDFRQLLFKNRSYIPIPFLVVMLIFAKPTIVSLMYGFSVVILGEYFRLWGVAIAGSETRTTGPVGGTYLITTGPFAYVRNPLYLGNILIYCGIGTMSFALFPWLTVIAYVYFYFQYSLIVSLEEEHLTQKFGEEYKRYTKSVPRFFPSLIPYKQGVNEQPKLDWRRGFISEKRTLQAIVILTLLLFVIWQVRA